MTLLPNVLGEGMPGPLAPGAEQTGFDGRGEDLQMESRVAEAEQGDADDGHTIKLIYTVLVLVIAI